MPAIITDTFDYDDIVRVLDLDEAFVHHQIDALQPKYWRVVIKTKPKGLKIFAPVMVSDIHAEPRLADNKEAAVARLYAFRSVSPDGRLSPRRFHVS